LKRSSRLTRSDDIKRVRGEGTSFAQETMVLVLLPNDLEENRIAVIAGRSIGGAVQRNLAKRRLRSAFQGFQHELQKGYDLVLIARRPILESDYQTLLDELRALFKQAELLKDKVC
jgi:ribonuclease P protein component